VPVLGLTLERRLLLAPIVLCEHRRKYLFALKGGKLGRNGKRQTKVSTVRNKLVWLLCFHDDALAVESWTKVKETLEETGGRPGLGLDGQRHSKGREATNFSVNQKIAHHQIGWLLHVDKVKF